MKKPERELLLLLPEERYDDVALEHEAFCLHQMLDKVDAVAHVAAAVEFLNLHRGGITNQRLRVEQALRRPVLGPFQFILHKN